MEYVAVAFRSRSDSQEFKNYLLNYGIRAEIINTPKDAGVGCGLSVKTRQEDFYSVKNAVRAFGGKSFAGFFLVRNSGGKSFVKTL